MKKIFLLLSIFISVISSQAQNSNNGSENAVAKNSQITFSAIASDGIIDNLNIYPNPVIDMLKITFRSSRKSTAEISLFNNIGKQVYTQETEVENGNNNISIDIRSKAIEPGIYFLKCVAEKEVITRKLIVK
jgi:endoglucanase